VINKSWNTHEWARGSLGLKPLRRRVTAKGLRPQAAARQKATAKLRRIWCLLCHNVGLSVYFLFPTCGRRKSSKSRLATELGLGSTCGSRRSKKRKKKCKKIAQESDTPRILKNRLAAAAGRKKWGENLKEEQGNEIQRCPCIRRRDGGRGHPKITIGLGCVERIFSIDQLIFQYTTRYFRYITLMESRHRY